MLVRGRTKKRSDGRERAAAVIRFVFVTGMPSGVMARQKLFSFLNVAQLIGVLRLITIYSGISSTAAAATTQ